MCFEQLKDVQLSLSPPILCRMPGEQLSSFDARPRIQMLLSRWHLMLRKIKSPQATKVFDVAQNHGPGCACRVCNNSWTGLQFHPQVTKEMRTPVKTG